MLKIMFGSIGLVLLATPLLVSADMASDLQACAVQPATTDSLTRCVTGLLAQIAAMETSVISDTSSGSSASGGATAGATSCVSISNFLSAGDTDKNSDDEVTKLQQFLVSQGASIYPEGLVTGYFGPATERALKRFQTAQGIVSSGSPETTGYGATGPQTRKRIAEMTGCGSAGQTTTSAQTTPPPNFSASPTSGPAPLTVRFASGVGSAIDFGDGTSDLFPYCLAIGCSTQGFVIGHTYSSAGTYTARALYGNQTVGTATITVGGQTVFTASPTSGPAPLLVSFNTSASGDNGDLTINFGDGQTSIFEKGQTHYYTSPGTYVATLMQQPPFVCNAPTGGACAQVMPALRTIGTATITVGGQTVFTASPTSGPAPLLVSFNTSASGDNGEITINFGDGQTSIFEKGQTHYYTSPGTSVSTLMQQPPFVCNAPTGGACAQVMPALRTIGTATITVGGQQNYRIGLVYPDAGQTFSPGDTISVQWKYANLAGTVVNVTLDSVDAQRHLATYVPVEKGGATITLPVTDNLGTLREGPATLSVWVTKISDGDPR